MPQPIQFFFISPFRTLVNLKSEFLTEKASLISDLTSATTKKLSSEIPTLSSGMNINSNEELRYSSLNQDDLTSLCSPLFLFEGTELHKKILGDELARCGEFKNFDVHSVAFQFFDNTIGICTSRITVTIKGNETIFPDDESVTNAHRALISRMQENEFSKLYKSFYEIFRAHDLCVKNYAYQKFFDLKSKILYRDNQPPYLGDSVLWVARILVVPKENNIPSSSKINWTHQPTPNKNILSSSSEIELNIGNSVITSDNQQEILDTIKSIEICQLYYSLFDILGKNIIRLHGACSVQRKRKKLDELLSVIENTIHYTQYALSDWRDLNFGVQGVRKRVIQAANDVWRIDDLISNVTFKSNITAHQADYIIKNNTFNFYKIAETLLAMIGGLSLIDFTFSLIAYAQSPEYKADGFPGILDALTETPIDAGLSLAILILAVVIIIYHRFRS